MSCPAITNKGGKLSISRFPVACELTLPELALIDYAVVPGVGSIGDTGIEQEISSYSTVNAGMSPQSKAAAVGKAWDVEMIESQSAARDVFETASAVANKDTYATRIEWPDGAVEFSIVQVSSPTYVKGAPSGVRIVRYTMIPSFIPIVTSSLPVASNVAIGGIPFIGATLTATYSYYSPLGLPESGTEYQWYADGVAIPGETSTSLLVTGGHLGSLITFGATPSDGLSYGHEVISVSVGPVADSARFTADAPDLYTDTSLTVPVASYGDAVAGWRGGVLVGVQPTLTARPAWGAMPSAPNAPILYYDLGDDVLPSAMELPEVTGGTLVIAGENGIWIDDSFSHAGGSWSLGPTTYTGGPAGLLPSVIGNRVLGFAVFANSLTPEQLQVEVEYWMAKGAPGVWEHDANLVTNGTFPASVDGWTANDNAAIVWDSGELELTTSVSASTHQDAPISVTSGEIYYAEVDMRLLSGNNMALNVRPNPILSGGVIVNLISQSSPATTTKFRSVAPATSTDATAYIHLVLGGAGVGYYDNIVLNKLTLNTDPYP